MKYGAFLLIIMALSLSAEKGVKSAVASDVSEGKTVYVPIKAPIDLREEVRIQERDQNMTLHGGQK
ncbi:MAG: hypothetical protein PHQ90_11145 [Sulfuricurvum sp.]|nr:hypothetical protein [Sulfuricurvum sp.]